MVSFDAGPHSADKGGNIPAVEHGVTGIDQTADLLGETVKKSYELLLVKKDAVLFGIAHIFHCYVDALVYHAAGPVQQDLQRAGSPAVPLLGGKATLVGMHNHGGSVELMIEATSLVVLLFHELLLWAAGDGALLHKRGVEGNRQMGEDWDLTDQIFVKIGCGPAGGKFYTYREVWEGTDALRQPGVVLKGHAVSR